jgi:class 3 adenylate cyclase
MDAPPPKNDVSGQREVAVIMFTDAVSFSARVHEQEVPTLHRLERDVEFMRERCAAFAGRVLKSTGDGLLVQFSSAVQAVSCAVEIQRAFGSRIPHQGEPQFLRHRIGIHLGDVFVSEGDLMGDGVNVAARLMGEAAAGGIVISRMVYDLVKNKLPLNVQHLGPRQLKNIREPVDMIRVLPEGPKGAAPAPVATVPAGNTGQPPQEARPRSRRPLMVLTGMVAVAAAAYGLWRAQEAHERGLAESQQAQARLDELLRKEKSAGNSTATDAARADAPRRNFAALVSSEPASAEKRGADLVAEARQQEAVLLEWVRSRLGTYTRARPLRVRGLGDPAFADTTLYSERDGLYFVEGGAHRRRDWDELPRSAHAAIIVAVLRDAVPPPPPEIRHALEAYAFLHGQPAMLR